MFCPNCGNDCTDEEFCPACGQNLLSAEDIDILAPPIGKYDGIDGYIELSFYTLTIHKEILGTTVEHVMFYRDIADVTFHQASNTECGYLAIRETEDLQMPVKTELDAACDKKTVIFSWKMNTEFCRLNSYLQDLFDGEVVGECATKNAESMQSQNTSNQDGIFCPKCRSGRCYVRPYDMMRLNKYDSCLLIKMLAAWVALYYCSQRKKRVYVCKKCGYQWSKW